jgi:nicotinamidase-related amidase
MSDALPFGPLGPDTVHLCVDMQNLFARETPWHTPWMPRVAPLVERLAEAHAADTIFTRFVPPEDAAELPGSWRRYYDRWREMLRDRLAPDDVDIIPSLARLAPPAMVVDKMRYSAFSSPALAPELARRRTKALVVTGAETDVCVLASVLDAVDRGFRVILARDAICSGSDRTHDALVTLYERRFSQQIETASVEQILASWAIAPPASAARG